MNADWINAIFGLAGTGVKFLGPVLQNIFGLFAKLFG